MKYDKIGRKGEGYPMAKVTCPCCGKEVEPEHMACVSGAKGGSSGVGEVKSRGSEKARKAVLVRWAREKAKKMKEMEPEIEPEDFGSLKV